jgi:hypothetical protein
MFAGYPVVIAAFTFNPRAANIGTIPLMYVSVPGDSPTSSTVTVIRAAYLA